MKVPKRGLGSLAAAMFSLLLALPAFPVLASWVALAAAPAATSGAPSVIPKPKRVTLASGSFELSSTTPVMAASGEPERIARYFSDLVSRTTSVQLRAGGSGPRAIHLALDGSAPAGEGYSIAITPDGITVRAREARGLFYGAVSLWQLMTANAPAIASAAPTNKVVLPALTIDDAPRFVWRGLMLDVARHYMPPADIKRLLDQMALHKLNTFHWHLTDDQGWRLQIKKYPLLTEIGAWRVPAGSTPASDIDPKTGKPRVYGGFYRQDEVREIVRYAAERFITVVPEIEMPGHAQAAIAAYPQLGTEGAKPPVSSDWGVHDYLYNVDEATFSFLEDVLTEVMELFPGNTFTSGVMRPRRIAGVPRLAYSSACANSECRAKRLCRATSRIESRRFSARRAAS